MISDRDLTALAIKKNWASLGFALDTVSRDAALTISIPASFFIFYLFDPLIYQTVGTSWANENNNTIRRFYVGYSCFSVYNLVITGTALLEFGIWRYGATPNGGNYVQKTNYMRLTQSAAVNQVFTFDFGGTDSNEWGCAEFTVSTAAASTIDCTIYGIFTGRCLTRPFG